MSILYQYPLLSYALRMVLVSAACYGYYHICLRNRTFHTYNRTYLLTGTLLALILPLVHIPGAWLPAGAAHPLILALTGAPAPRVNLATLPSAAPPTARLLVSGLYILVVTFLLLRLSRSIYRVIRLARRSSSIRMDSIRVFQASGTGAPFSFLSWLFWDPALDPTEGQGRLIFLHESHHIRDRHTLDVLALEIAKAVCWFNPFFYWTLRELKTLHEFAADRYALSQKNTAVDEHFDYAELLVWQSIGNPIFSVTHSFFHNQLKRRITMITQTSRRTSGPLTRILALPMLLLLTVLFTTTPAHTQATGDTSNTNQLLRWFSRHLRYPEANLNAHKEGTIWFTVKMGEGGNLVGFTPLDQKPAGQLVQRINALSLQHDAKPGGPMSDEEAHKHFMDDAQQAAENMNSPHPRDEYLNTVAPGQYYFEIVYKIEK